MVLMLLLLHILGPVHELLLGRRLVYAGSNAARATILEHLWPCRLLVAGRLKVRLHNGSLL